MIPRAWSHSSLDAFVTCPRRFHEVKILKSVVEEESEEQRYGLWVHKEFEERQVRGKHGFYWLSPKLAEHEPFMVSLNNQPGEHFTERKVALNKQLQSCDFLAPDAWFRGIIDFSTVSYQFATVVDYKTGKPHRKFNQLRLCALWVFAAYPKVIEVNARYYWTKTKEVTQVTYKREEVPRLWSEFIPDLKQYVEAFKTDTWKPKPSGLCHGYCPVIECDYWRPRRNK